MQLDIRMVLSILVYACTVQAFANTTVWHFTPSDINTLHSKSADHRIPYGNDALQYIDLRLPQGKGPYPVVVIVHGGCWIANFASAQNTAALADALRDLGYATWNIEYRREDNKGGGWPGTFEDVATATDLLTQEASKYSLDLNKVIILGHSAGGHLALWLTARHKLSPQSPLYTKNPFVPKGVISLDGVPDLKAFRKQGKITCGTDAVGKLLGTSENEITQHYHDASPSELLPLQVSQLLLYGAEDQSVPLKFGVVYQKLAEKKGDNVKLIKINYAAHHEAIVPNSVTWPAVKASIEFLLAKQDEDSIKKK